ncbi:MAG: DNA polymerase-3 subunit epsilon [Granulosicoccus sp.]|jgi:DNA polymerase-3 subunit epsilon
MSLPKPIVFFDLETTGVSITQDRIVQIGAIKVNPDGTEEIKNVLVNPTIPIPAGATEIHGISDADVQDKPLFRQVAKSFASWLSGCDLAGYNSDNFDVPMLIEEFMRVEIAFPEKETKFIDVLKIERKVNSHKLGETYQRYTGEELEGAHDALIDIYATIKIFHQQLEQNEHLPTGAAAIEAFCQGEFQRVDFAGKLYEKEGQVYWRFGKHKDQLVSETKSYCNWVLGSDFPSETKAQIRRVLEM